MLQHFLLIFVARTKIVLGGSSSNFDSIGLIIKSYHHDYGDFTHTVFKIDRVHSKKKLAFIHITSCWDAHEIVDHSFSNRNCLLKFFKFLRRFFT